MKSGHGSPGEFQILTQLKLVSAAGRDLATNFFSSGGGFLVLGLPWVVSRN